MATKSSAATGGGYDGSEGMVLTLDEEGKRKVRVGRLIAKGAFSLVYEAYDLDNDNNTTNNG